MEGETESPAQTYNRDGVLDFVDSISSGFYDTGRNVFPLPSLESLREIPPNKGREVILVDEAKDRKLLIMKELALETVHVMREDPEKERAIAVAKLIDTRMGGQDRDILSNSQKLITHLKEKMRNNVVLLGDISQGVCRHRAIMFKYLSDACGIKSRLVRVYYLGGTGF